MKEPNYDELLNIKTGEDHVRFYKSFHYHPYEPTPYSALKTLFQQYELKSSDRLVDFGCGKGRLSFFVEHFFGIRTVGIEMNEMFYEAAMENRHSFAKKRKLKDDHLLFHCCLAEEYLIDDEDNVFYFFNPFSIVIFRQVVDRILESNEQCDREIQLILYYSSEDYIYFLERETMFQLKQEVILPGLYERNTYERFLVYTLS